MEDDPEFEVTAEMLVHDDLDDEATLEEEEASTQPEDVQDELAGLEQEGEMPLEQLLALYGCAADGYRGTALEQEEEGEEEGEEEEGEEEEGECKVENASLVPPKADAAMLTHPFAGVPCSEDPPTSAVVPEDHVGANAAGGHMSGTSSPVQHPHPPSHTPPPARANTDSPTHPYHPHSSTEQLGVAVEGTTITTTITTIVGAQPTSGERDQRGDWAPGTEGVGPRALAATQSAEPAALASECPLPSRRGRVRREEGKYRLRPEVPERRSTRLMHNEAAAVEAYFASVLEGGSDDDENSTGEDWKREVKLGPEHQAEVAVQPSLSPYLCDTYDDKIVWKPDGIDENEVSRYLSAVAEQVTGHPPPTTNPHDNERALEILQRFHHDTQHALKWIRTRGLPEGTAPWTEDECKRFEAGLKSVGKDFSALSKQINTRTFKELVEFYYVWKKTEGYSTSAQQGRLTRKKVTLQPGCATMDFMERLLDLQDRGDDSDVLYATSSVATEAKKDN